MLTLQQLKVYLQKHGATTLAKISKDFTESPEQIMCVAQHYIAKGKIYCEQKTVNCGTTCHSCFSSKLSKISWVKSK